MGEITDYIRVYIEDSGMLEEELNNILINLKANIQGQLKPGHGVITHDLHDSIETDIESQSKTSAIIRAYSEIEYAPWVNDGHSQQPGRFIPGQWDGNRFKYQPGAKTGMVLKKSYVKGLHFMEKGLEATVAMYR